MIRKHDYADHSAGDCAYDHRAEDVKMSVLGVAVALTLGFSAVELFAGLMANSLALIGDAGHMATDSASLLFALVANLISRKGVDADHSFGHGRVEVLAAFLNGLVMLVVVGWIFFEAFERLENPAQVNGGSVMIVAVIGLVINVAVAWSLSRDRKNVNTRAALVHVMGALVLHSTYEVLRDSSAVLLDAVPEGVKFSDVGDALSGIKGVLRVHDLHVWTIAPGRGAVMAHLCMRRDVDWDSVLADARQMLLDRFGLEHVTLQPEWDTDPEHDQADSSEPEKSA